METKKKTLKNLMSRLLMVWILFAGWFVMGNNLVVLAENSTVESQANSSPVEITTAKEAEVKVYFQNNNFHDSEISVDSKTENSDGTVTWKFYVSKSNGSFTYRVSQDGYVTKAGYLSLASEDSTKLTVIPDRMDEKSHSKEGLGTTVINRDEADIVMNVSNQNELDLETGETFRMRSYRIWEIVNNDTGNIMIEPDFDYQILSGSDCILVNTVQENYTNGTGNWLDITAKKEGVAVLAVTYRAIDVAGSASHGGFYPALSKERTGVVVVKVGEKENDITSIGLKNGAGKEWNWNFDTFFFDKKEKEGKMTITPVAESGIAKVEAAYVETTEELNSTLSNWTEIMESEEAGVYELPVKEGNHIIKITSKAGKTAYQVVRVKGVTIKIENVTNPGEIIQPGNTVKVSFEGLNRSIPKMSGLFNPSTLQILGTDATGTEVAGSISQYQRADTASWTIVLPEDIAFEENSTKTEYRIKGSYIKLASMYSYEKWDHFLYDMTDDGVGTNFNAVNVTGANSTLMDVSIPVEKTVTEKAALHVVDETGKEITGYDSRIKSADGTVISSLDSLTYGTYSYEIKKAGYLVKRDTFYIGSTSEKQNDVIVIEVVLSSAKTENAWDGVSVVEPEVDENGAYRIKTGAELAWFATKVNESEANTTSNLNAKLEADIDLAGFEFMKIGYYNSSSSYVSYGGTFDGNHHSIYHLYIDHKTTTSAAFYDGLFSYTNGAVIKNLTVDGCVMASSTGSVSNAYVGGIAGYLNNTTLSNVKADVDVVITRNKGNYQYVGGVAGYVNGSSRLENVTNLGSTAGYNYVGGITGYTNGAVVLKNLHNEGKVTGNNYVAGITGLAKSTQSADMLSNKGEISGTSYLGGLEGSHQAVGSLTNGWNAGTVTAKSNYAGGIIGSGSVAASSITNLINDGSVKANSYAGGLIAMSSVHVTVTNGWNFGTVTSGGNYAGGIVSYSYGTGGSTYRDLASIGKVSGGGSYTGSVAGYAKTGEYKKVFALKDDRNLFGQSDLLEENKEAVCLDTAEEVVIAKSMDIVFSDIPAEKSEHLKEVIAPYYEKLTDQKEEFLERLAVPDEICEDQIIENEVKKLITSDVYVSAQADYTFLAAPQVFTVNAYEAEKYGLSDRCEKNVSALDVLVAEHELIFGEEFHENTAGDYLESSKDGMITKAFGMDTSSFGFTVDGVQPHDDILIESSYGNYYTGYMIDETKIETNATIEFFIYQDAYYSDLYVSNENGNKITGKRGEEIPLKLSGYPLAYYGCSTQEEIDGAKQPVSGAQIALVNEKTGELTPFSNGITDEDGNAEILFKKQGNYLVTAYVENGTVPIFMPLLHVEVTENIELDRKEAQVTAEWMDGKIESIGEITLEKETLVKNIRASYETLTDLEKSYVTKLSVLEAAETKIAELKEEKAKEEQERIEEEKKKKENIQSEVFVSAQAKNTFLAAPQTQRVNAYMAEKYGYSDACEERVSALDVLVAEHEIIFGRDFNEKTAKNYLEVTESGFLVNVFGMDTSNFGFAVDGAFPHDDVLIESSYGNYYTGDTICTAEIPEKATVEFFIYQDDFWEDIYVSNASGSSITGRRGEKLSMTLSGYGFMGNGCMEQSVIDAATHPVESAVLAVIDTKTGKLTPIKDAVTDADGKAVISFETPGNYLVTAYAGEQKTPLIMPVIQVEITENEELDAKEMAQSMAAWVDEKIAAIGEVTLEKADRIKNVRASYEILTEEEKSYVTKLSVLEDAERAYQTLDDQAKAAEVDAKITGLDSTSKDFKEQVLLAKSVYDGLTESQKQQVTKYAELQKAEKMVSDMLKAEEIVKQIDEIGNITLESKEKIEQIRAAYDLLSEEQKAFVTNLSVLEEAEKTCIRLKNEFEEEQRKQQEEAAKTEAAKQKASLVDKKITAIGTVTLDKKEAIKEARKAYEALTEEEKAFVTKADLLSAKEQNIADLEAAREENEKLQEENRRLEEEKKLKMQFIDGVPKKIVKTENSKSFLLKAKASTALTFKSSDRAVVKVGKKSGIVTIKKAGKAVITIVASGKGYQTVTRKVKITVRPKKAKILSIKTQGEKTAAISYRKNKNADGCQILYSTSVNFTSSRKITVKGTESTKQVIKNLKRNKKYYFKVRSYKMSGKKKVYGEYSKIKSFEVK